MTRLRLSQSTVWVWLPAVDHNGVVPCPDLNFSDLLNDIGERLQIATLPVRGPVGDVELAHLVGFATLEEERELVASGKGATPTGLPWTPGHSGTAGQTPPISPHPNGQRCTLQTFAPPWWASTGS